MTTVYRAGDLPDTEAAVFAIAELCERSGARHFEIGYDDDVEPATWWAGVTYNGAKLHTDGHRMPADAADALAAKVLTGGLCMSCGQRSTLLGLPGVLCVWRRIGRRWTPGCR